MTLTPRVRAWEESGGLISYGGQRIFVRTRAGSGTPMLLLHGFPSSSYDWRAVLDALPDRAAVCFDFLGFGLSDKPCDHTYSLLEAADLTEAIVRDHLSGPLLLVAHDMGTSVATELLARDLDGRLSFEPAAVLLLNGSMVIERASLTISQRALRSRFGPLVARLSNERTFRAQFKRIFSAAHPLDAEEAADQWALLEHNGGHRILDRLTHYLHERVRYASRWHGALRRWPGMLELAWAGRDPVCTESVLQAILELRPAAELTRLPQLGHYPQIEDPATVASIIEEVLGRIG